MNSGYWRYAAGKQQKYLIQATKVQWKQERKQSKKQTKGLSGCISQTTRTWRVDIFFNLPPTHHIFKPEGWLIFLGGFNLAG